MKPTVYQLLDTWLQTPAPCDLSRLFARYGFQAVGNYNPAVLSLNFLSLHLIAQSIMWTAWDDSTSRGKVSRRILQQRLC